MSKNFAWLCCIWKCQEISHPSLENHQNTMEHTGNTNMVSQNLKNNNVLMTYILNIDRGPYVFIGFFWCWHVSTFNLTPKMILFNLGKFFFETRHFMAGFTFITFSPPRYYARRNLEASTQLGPSPSQNRPITVDSLLRTVRMGENCQPILTLDACWLPLPTLRDGSKLAVTNVGG